MLALCRLLERQGIFKGDLGTLQQLALQAVIVNEQKELIALEKSRFKSALIAAHPQHAEAILAEDTDESGAPDPDGFDAFDETGDHTLSVEDFAAMQSLLANIETDGYDVTEYEN